MQKTDPAKDDFPKIRILVVEDVANVAEVLVARLESFGYKVCAVVDTGLKAISSAFDQNPDLILMDIMLIGSMNGIEAAGRINEKMDIPIIYLSCINDQEVLDRALETHPYGFIMKPYDQAELRFSIENALARYRDTRQQKKRIAELKVDDGG